MTHFYLAKAPYLAGIFCTIIKMPQICWPKFIKSRADLLIEEVAPPKLEGRSLGQEMVATPIIYKDRIPNHLQLTLFPDFLIITSFYFW